MKNIFILFTTVILLLMVPMASAGLLVEPSTPSTVLPGSFFPLAIKITNPTAGAINNIKVSLDLSESLDVDDETKTISSLLAGQSILLQWSVEVRSGTSSGYKRIIIDVKSSEPDQEIDVPVLIKAAEPTLEIQRIDTHPSPLQPGAAGEIILAVQNLASYSLRDIHLAMGLTPAMPIAPREGTEERIIKLLRAGEKYSLSFDIIILPDGEPGWYTIPLRLSYVDEFGQNYTRTNTIAVEINVIPQLEITAEGKLLQGKPGEIVLKVVNKGLTPIQFLTIHLQHPALISSSSIYVGNLEKDDFQTEQITLLAESSFPLPATVEFRDALNKVYTEQISIPIIVVDEATAQRLGLTKPSFWLYIILSIVAVVVLYLVQKRLRRRKL